MSWQVRHEGSPNATPNLTGQQVLTGVAEGVWEPFDEVRGPGDEFPPPLAREPGPAIDAARDDAVIQRLRSCYAAKGGRMQSCGAGLTLRSERDARRKISYPMFAPSCAEWIPRSRSRKSALSGLRSCCPACPR